jgi:hypothetical protein
MYNPWQISFLHPFFKFITDMALGESRTNWAFLGYLSYDIEFDRVEDLYDLIKPADVSLRFVSTLGSQAKSWNFSKHFDPSHGENHPNLTLRMNVFDEALAKKIIEKTASMIAGEGKLRMFVGPNNWQEDDDVLVRALEASSECAIRMARVVSRKDTDLSLEIIHKKTNWNLFVIQVLLRILDISGFHVYLRRSYREQFKIQDSDLDKLANDLAAVWWNRGAVTDPDGIDEFVHCFLNVTASSPPEAEKVFQKFVSTSAIYRGIFETKKRGPS